MICPTGMESPLQKLCKMHKIFSVFSLNHTVFFLNKPLYIWEKYVIIQP